MKLYPGVHNLMLVIRVVIQYHIFLLVFEHKEWWYYRLLEQKNHINHHVCMTPCCSKRLLFSAYYMALAFSVITSTTFSSPFTLPQFYICTHIAQKGKALCKLQACRLSTNIVYLVCLTILSGTTKTCNWVVSFHPMAFKRSVCFLSCSHYSGAIVPLISERKVFWINTDC